MNNSNFAQGVAIIAKYVKPDDYNAHANHDQLWFGPIDCVSDADAARLRELGWFEDQDAWSCHV